MTQLKVSQRESHKEDLLHVKIASHDDDSP